MTTGIENAPDHVLLKRIQENDAQLQNFTERFLPFFGEYAHRVKQSIKVRNMLKAEFDRRNHDQPSHRV